MARPRRQSTHRTEEILRSLVHLRSFALQAIAVVAHAPGDEEVYWQGADGYLWESAESGGQWRGPVRTPIGGLASSPTATIGPGGADYVFWEVPPPSTQTAPVPVTIQPPKAGPERRIRVKIVMSWSWSRTRTRLRAIRFGRFPTPATIRVTCHGRACPRRLGTARRRHLRALMRSLEARVFRAGQQLTITISAPGWIPERAQIRIRDGALPLARLL
jgi:hypothetical protein